MTESREQSNIDLVRSLFAGFGEPAAMRSALQTYLSEDCQYGATLKGRDSMLRWLFGEQYNAPDPHCFWPDGLEVREHNVSALVRIVPEIKHMAANGDLVFVERVDHHYDAEGQDVLISPIVGVMEIRDGKIVKWRDHSAFNPD